MSKIILDANVPPGPVDFAQAMAQRSLSADEHMANVQATSAASDYSASNAAGCDAQRAAQAAAGSDAASIAAMGTPNPGDVVNLALNATKPALPRPV